MVGGPDSPWLLDRNLEPPAFVVPILPTHSALPQPKCPRRVALWWICFLINTTSLAGSRGQNESHAFQCLLTSTGGLEKALAPTTPDHSSLVTHPQDQEAPCPRVTAVPRTAPSSPCAISHCRQSLVMRHSPPLVHFLTRHRGQHPVTGAQMPPQKLSPSFLVSFYI